MPTARKHQIILENTPYYHCTSRCVRRSFLCGDDKYTGKNFDHRKQWILDRLALLASIFAIDVYAFGLMSSHYHLVLKIDVSQTKKWTKEDVIQRWGQLFKGDLITQLYIKGYPISESEIQILYKKAETWREKLMSISWFMRCLNQPIAQMANKEDNCKGRFWEGRFTSQALLDEQAILAAMVYVDLNPIRAGICNNIESSEFTSIAQRLREYSQPEYFSSVPTQAQTSQSVDEHMPTKKIKQTSKQSSLKPNSTLSRPFKTKVPLAQFIGSQQNRTGIPYSLEDYFELADWTGRAIRRDKKGYIPESEPKIIRKLGISTDTWLDTISNFKHYFYIFIGHKEILTQICQKLNKKWLTGIKPCRRLFNHLNSLSDN